MTYPYTAYLSYTGLLVPLNELSADPSYSKLLNKMTICHRPKIGPPQYAKMYEFVTIGGLKMIRIPRTYTLLFKTKVLYKALRPILIPIGVLETLYKNQITLINHMCDVIYTPQRIATGTATCLLNLRAGMGKTFVAAGLIARLQVKTLYIVAKCALMVQAVKDLKGSLDTSLIGQLGGPKKCKVTTPLITVCVINSALLQPASFFSQFDLVIMDEVHQFCSPSRRKIFGMACAPMILAMSATTEDRTDGFDPIVHKELAFDGILRAEQIEGFTYDEVNFTTKVTAIVYNGPPSHTEALTHPSTERLFCPSMYKQFLDDPYRMKMVIAELRELYDWRGPEGQQHCIYVFSEERSPLAVIAAKMQEALGADVYVDAGEFIGGINDAQIAKITASARIILTTYAYSSTGISIDRATAIVFLTPRRSNMIQILARILRRGGDQSITRRVIDIIDNRTPMKGQFSSRKIGYEYYKMEVERKKVEYTNL